MIAMFFYCERREGVVMGRGTELWVRVYLAARESGLSAMESARHADLACYWGGTEGLGAVSRESAGAASGVAGSR